MAKKLQNKRERRDGEEVHRSNGLAMVSEEREPSLHGIWISRSSTDPSRDAPLRNIETQLEQFTVLPMRWLFCEANNGKGDCLDSRPRKLPLN
jgi:hypothetical protein